MGRAGFPLEERAPSSRSPVGGGPPLQEGLRTAGFLWLHWRLEPKPMPTIHRYFAFTYYPRRAAEENG